MPEARSRLSDVLDRQQDESRERALRALLMRPLLPADAPEFVDVRAHADWLRDWFGRECGWPLLIERDCARLYKRPAELGDSTRGAQDRDKREFDRDRYVLLCLVCAVLERAEPQITLRALGERLLDAARDPELAALGYQYTLENLRERRDLVLVCRFLLDLGVLARVAGDEEAYVNQAGDVLYDVQRRALAALPGSSRGASLIEALLPRADFESRLAALVEDYVPDSPEGRRTATRHRLSRRLLDDPVVYHDELDDSEREYLATQRGTMSARLAAASGLTAELRAEGFALVDEDGELSDERLPAQGTESHVTLLVAEFLGDAARKHPQRLFGAREVADYVADAAGEFGRYWRKAAREPGAENALADQALQRLARLKLVEFRSGGVRARPALLRFALGEAEIRGKQQTLL